MDIKFGGLTFSINSSGKIFLNDFYGFNSDNKGVFCEVDVPGGTTSGTLCLRGSECAKSLKYCSHNIENGVLTVVQANDIFELISVFESYSDTGAIRVTQKLKNISKKAQCIELLGTLGLYFGEKGGADCKDWFFHKFTNYRYSEGMPTVQSFSDCGLYYVYGSMHIENLGNHSAHEYLPQGIIEHRPSGKFLMFGIESYSDWRYEISVTQGKYCLQLGGATKRYHDWQYELVPGEVLESVSASICYGKSVNEVIAEMTRYRRHLRPTCASDKHLPSIYNEYMHYSWDDPYASVTSKTAPAVAKSGCEYYIIDCGWQAAPTPKGADTTDIVYRLFGTWYENTDRFPGGIKETAKLVKSLGMKFGLWIAPEVVGVNNKEMLDYYDDECFFTRNGVKLRNSTGYLLDYRNPKVYDYMSRAIDRMVNEYGCDYIKFDGCLHAGAGTEVDSFSLGDGLVRAMDAFLDWTKDMMERYPNVLFEDCAGGGQRIDYKALSMFHLLSTSDQMRYDHYPYIVGNIFCSVLPEQAGVWSYPVDSALYDENNEAATDGKVSRERVVINMVNSILGRIHLASRIQLLSEEKQALIKEGVDYYNSITEDKLNAVPYLPKGYTDFGDTFVSCGLKTEKKIYLAVWNLNGDRSVKLPLPEVKAESVKVAYPCRQMGDFGVTLENGTLDIVFGEDEQARIIEITLK